MANHNYREAAAPIEVLSSPGAQIARIECSQCGRHDDWRISRLPPPEILHKHFADREWSIRRRVVCPDCQTRKEKPKMSIVQMPKQPPQAQAPNADAAAKNKRIVILALEDYFDEAQRRYRDGRTDQSVAKELNLAPAFVQAVREEFFGKLAEPSEVGDVRAQVEAIKAQIGSLEKRLGELAAKNGWV